MQSKKRQKSKTLKIMFFYCFVLSYCHYYFEQTKEKEKNLCYFNGNSEEKKNDEKISLLSRMMMSLFIPNFCDLIIFFLFQKERQSKADRKMVESNDVRKVVIDRQIVRFK